MAKDTAAQYIETLYTHIPKSIPIQSFLKGGAGGDFFSKKFPPA